MNLLKGSTCCKIVNDIVMVDNVFSLQQTYQVGFVPAHRTRQVAVSLHVHVGLLKIYLRIWGEGQRKGSVI